MDKLHDVEGSIDIVLSIPGKTKEEAEGLSNSVH